jgi:ABC-type transport system involved in cytochrome bd biosynthesis fused ATPase/permease subunit
MCDPREQLLNLASATRELAIGLEGLARRAEEPDAEALCTMLLAFREVHQAAISIASGAEPSTLARALSGLHSR